MRKRTFAGTIPPCNFFQPSTGLLWYSPLSWWMHNRIVRAAEEASDDAALAVMEDRAAYAETLLQFVERGMKVAHWEGVAMARYGNADDRIHRILNETAISRGVTRFGLASILHCPFCGSASG